MATNYIQTYIDWYKTETGAYPTRTLTTEYYVGAFVENAKIYAKDNELSKTEEITLDEVADFTATYGSQTPTVDGYTYAKGAMENVSATILSVDNGGTLKYYFDKNSNKVIFDAATMTVGDETADVTIENTPAANASSFYTNGLTYSTEWGYHGDNSLHLGMTGGAWDWASINFNTPVYFAPTNTFSMVIKLHQTMAYDLKLGFQITTASGVKYTENTFANLVKDDGGILRKAGEENEVYVATFHITTPISDISSFSFYLRTAQKEQDEWLTVNPFWFDYICAEYSGVEEEDPNVLFNGATMSVALNNENTDVSVGGYYENPTDNNGIKAATNWGYKGSSSINVSSTGGGWLYALDITFNQAVTFESTNTFSLMTYWDRNVAIKQYINFKVITEDGTEYELKKQIYRGGDVPEDGVKQTFTLPTAITNIKKISFYMSGELIEAYTDITAGWWYGLQPFNVDYIRAEYPNS